MADDLTIGELFPADDLVGQWVFSLSATAADLSSVENALRSAMEEDGAVAGRFYFHRQLISRLYEARRVIVVVDTCPKIEQFLDEIPKAADPITFLRERYLPPDDSVVSRLYGVHRHRTIHHAFVGSTELEETLRVAADERARNVVNRGSKTVHIEFPEATMMRFLYPDIDQEEGRSKLLKEHADLGQSILNRFATLINPVTMAWLDRRDIDPTRLFIPTDD